MLTAEHNPYSDIVRMPTLGSDIRLRVYEPDGETPRGIINDALEIEVYDRGGQTPTLTVKATNHAPSTRYLLQGPCIVAVEMMVQYKTDLDHFVYDELRNMRFVIMDVSHDRSLSSDPTDTYTFKGVGLFHLFEGARVMLDPQPQQEGDGEQANQKADKRAFINTTPGAIVGTLFNEAKDRGELIPIKVGFTAEEDSFGNPWPTVSREYSPSTSLRTVISNMLESGLAEFWMDGNALFMSLIGEWDRRYRQTVTPLPYIRDLTPDSSPETVAYSDLISRVLLIGDEGYTREKWLQPDPYLMPFGGRTMVLEAGGVSTDVDADRMIDRALIEGGGAVRTYTRDWTYAGDQSPMGLLPFRDFNPGDWLDCDIDGEPRATMQVCDMSLKRSGTELTASVTLGSLRDDLLTRLARQTQALSDGAAVASTGRPKPVSQSGGGGQYDAHPGEYRGLKVTDQAGGLKAYRDKTDPNIPQEHNTSISVDKDTGDVALHGKINTSKTTFNSSSYSGPKEPLNIIGHYPGAATARLFASRNPSYTSYYDFVGLGSNGYANSSVVNTAIGPVTRAILGVVDNSAEDSASTDSIAAVVAEMEGSTNALFLKGQTINLIGAVTMNSSLEVGPVNTSKVTTESINVREPSLADKPVYAVYVDEDGKLFRANSPTPKDDILA